MNTNIRSNEIIKSKGIELLLDGEQLQVRFQISAFSKGSGTIYDINDQKIGEIEKLSGGDKTYFFLFGNRNRGLFKVNYRGQEIFVRKTKKRYTLENDGDFRFDAPSFRNLNIYYNEEQIGQVIYPSTHVVKSSLRIKLFDRSNEKHLFTIKMMLLAVSTNRAINVIDGLDPFASETLW